MSTTEQAHDNQAVDVESSTQTVEGTFVAINALEVSPERGDELAQRFAKRAGAVGGSPGFLRFELLRPLEGSRWLVVTWWKSRGDFEAWRTSQSFEQGHAQHRTQGPVAHGSELWELEVVQHEGAAVAR